MKVILFLAALFAAVSALTHNVAEVQNIEQADKIEARDSKKCALQLQAALNYPETPAASYLNQLSKRFQIASDVLYTTNNVSFIENFETSYGVFVVVHDSFANILYPASTSPIYSLISPMMGAPVYPAEINNPIVTYFAESAVYYTTFLVYSAFGEVKIVSLGLPAVKAPFFK